MTLSEFKAWFEGFTENLDGPPNKKQWARIQSRVKKIDGERISPVVIERWRDRYPYYTWQAYGASGTSKSLTISGSTTTVSNNTNILANLGRAEAMEIQTA